MQGKVCPPPVPVPPSRAGQKHFFRGAPGREDIEGPITAWAFPRWKWRFVRRCFPGKSVRFASGDAAPPRTGTLLLWGTAPVPERLAAGVRVLRMEDGFLRSVGLGAELTRPLSWVVDGSGIYYDATRPSDLETLLATADFPPALMARAAALRERVVAAGITKYNVGAQRWRRPAGARQVVLVPGQVESDASLAFGAPGIRSNLALLQAARAACPDAWLVYKPHPDVAARLRRRGDGEERAAEWCDEIVVDADMAALLDAVDAVHVLTSLAGFEALLRGKPVTCHGQPFYSGWGLTQDALPHPRRTRRLQRDELVAGALICYPTYLGERGPVPPEAALDALQAWKARRGGGERWWQEIYRFFLRRFIGVR
ncbi:capsule polysaccharide biosynthesis protein [Burkholderiales bacterium GJ-E10]|nr:capsule polysaccharide biosynthesis protein [Burkholderiales bacterium GJ-E10]